MKAGNIIGGTCVGCIGLLVLGFCASVMIGQSDSGKASRSTASRSTASSRTQRTAETQPQLEVSALVLYSAYDANVADFESRYGDDRTIKVTGTIKSVDEFAGDFIVRLRGEQGEYAWGSVDCYFDPAHQSALRKLSKGSWVAIIGKCDAGVGGPLLRYCRLAP